MTSTKEEIKKLLQEIGPGKMSSTAYDTAWVARLRDIDKDLSIQALEWICENQLSDGSWGAKDIFYYHDRVICTLAAMIALTYQGKRNRDRRQIEKGLEALDRITSGATQGLAADLNGSTAGFEMIAPTLVAEAEKLGIIKQQGDRILGRLGKLREQKIEKIAGRKINRYVTHAFSSEMAGADGQHILDIDNLQESNGSVANSPSATAYFVMSLKPSDPAGIKYLRRWMSADGGAPNVAPFDIFEPAWTLWNLKLIKNLDKETLSLCKNHLNFLENNWKPEIGIGHASEYTPKDSDDTSLVYETLAWFGRDNKDIKALLRYEEKDYFRCFEFEANPSVSANIHIAGALRQAGYDKNHPVLTKVINFLRETRTADGYWFDKWHASPYYPTSHFVLLMDGLDSKMCATAVQWIIQTQKKNGAWGVYSSPTAEETAYCLQTLIYWNQRGNHVPASIIKNGVEWLKQNTEPPYPPLWIGKALYSPENVVRSTILSALELGA